jgi:H+/gluconate symporter-like permease
LIAPFAFNSPVKVILALAIGVAGGILAGYVGGHFFKKHYAESDAHMEG